jgi:hypothetical protein
MKWKRLPVSAMRLSHRPHRRLRPAPVDRLDRLEGEPDAAWFINAEM